MKPFSRSLFATGAELLMCGAPYDDNEPAVCLLKDLGYLDSEGPVGDKATINTIKLLQCAAKMDLFALQVPDAPRMSFIGGRVIPERFFGYENFVGSSASGMEQTLAGAFESCVGEGIEYLSQLVPPGESLEFECIDISKSSDEAKSLDTWRGYKMFQQSVSCKQFCLPGESLVSNETHWVPWELCLRPEGGQTLGMSTGCAAGKSIADATVSALLELVERDATALWWEGGKQPQPISNESIGEAGIESLYCFAGRSSQKRATVILDITTDINVPCVAALSADLEDGARFSCGLACRTNLPDAIRKAVLEMMQMELSHHVLAMKRRVHGDSYLSEHDKMQLRRDRKLVDIWNTPLVQTKGRPNSVSTIPNDPQSSTDFVLERLSMKGFDAFVVDLSREALGVPVVKVFIPALQTYPLISVTTRLERMTVSTGGGCRHTGKVSLL